MSNSKFMSYLEYFYAYNKIPITCVKNDKLLFSIPKKNKLLSLINNLYYSNTTNKTANITYHFDSMFLGKIKVKSKNSSFDLIIGPVIKKYLNLKEIDLILKKLKLDIKEQSLITDELLVANPVDYEQFVNLMMLLDFTINNSSINEYNLISQYDIYDLEKMKSVNINKSNNDVFMEKLDNFIVEGNQLGFITFSNFYPNKDLIFDDINEDIQSFKNYIIYYLSIISTYAIKAGVDSKTTSKITKLMINKLNKTKTFKNAESIFNETLKIYFDRVSTLKNTKNYSNLVKMAITYINESLESPLTVNNIALKLNVTRNHLSKCFTKDTGTTIQQYIINSKLEHSKKLLESTNISVVEISKKLHFSSQSHFQNSFKKKYSLTPIQYRNNNQKIK